MELIHLVFYIFLSYGFYALAKKMNIKNPWIGWIPLAQYYTMSKIADKNFVKYILIPMIIMFISVGYMFFIIGIMFLGGNPEKIFFLGFIPAIIGLIYSIYRNIQVCSATSKRTGRGGWTTAGLFFIPFIMYPVIALKFKGLSEDKEEKVVEL